MWIAKLKGFDEGNIYASKTLKNNVSIHYYPTSHYLEKNIYYFIAVGVVEGGGKHTEIKNLQKALPDHLRGTKEMKKAVKELIDRGFLNVKPSTGELHISLNSQAKRNL